MMSDPLLRCETPYGTICLKLGHFYFKAKFPKGFIPRCPDGAAVLSPLYVHVTKRDASWGISSIKESEMDDVGIELDEETFQYINNTFKFPLNFALEHLQSILAERQNESE